MIVLNVDSAAGGLSLKRFRVYDPKQPYLLPPDPTEWLPDGHLAFFIHELVQHLDLSSIYSDYTPSVGGRPPLEPRMMVSVWIYAYAVGIRSSRKVQAWSSPALMDS